MLHIIPPPTPSKGGDKSTERGKPPTKKASRSINLYIAGGFYNTTTFNRVRLLNLIYHKIIKINITGLARTPNSHIFSTSKIVERKPVN